MSLSNFPPGVSDSTVGAPWNEPTVPDKEFDVTCSQTLSRTVPVITNNYVPGASGVDFEPDDEGGYYASGWQDPDDTSDTNWAEEYHDNDHYTPIQLIELYKNTLKEQLKSWEGMDDVVSAKAQIKRIEHLIEECSNWVEDETEYKED